MDHTPKTITIQGPKIIPRLQELVRLTKRAALIAMTKFEFDRSPDGKNDNHRYEDLKDELYKTYIPKIKQLEKMIESVKGYYSFQQKNGIEESVDLM